MTVFVLHAARRIVRTCARILAVIAMISVAGMMLTISYDVFARFAFRAPTDWAYPLNALGVLCVTALPVPYLYLERGHIAMDLIHRTLPRQLQTAANIVTAVAVGAFGAIVAVTAASSLPIAVDAGLTGTGTFNIPFWIHDAVLIVSGGFLLLVAALFPNMRGSDPVTSPEGVPPAASTTDESTPGPGLATDARTTEDEVQR